MIDRVVHIESHIKKTATGKPDVVDLEIIESATLNDIAGQLDIDNTTHLIAMVNSKRRPWNFPLRSGDRIEIFPMLGGG